MEPPSKRPRFGRAPFDDDDPEADELNSRPEEVNARRDPGLRLERSRAFAAFKLKSAFERIFEKYEKDFTGVGDEIDLRTGEIVVNNGHIQSLKDVQMGGADDEENSEHAASEAGSLNEERLWKGKADALPLIPQQAASSPFFGGGWSTPTPLLGGHPRPSAMMFPGHMQFGSFPMQYGAPVPGSATDPAWSTPELPSPFFRNGVGCGETGTPLLKKKARMSLAASPEHGGDEEDEIFLGSSTASQNGEKDERVVIKKKLLLPRPLAERLSAKKKKRPSMTDPKRCHNAATQGKSQSTRNTPQEKPSKQNRTTPKLGSTHSGASPMRLGTVLQNSAKEIDPPPEPIPAETGGLTSPVASASGSTNYDGYQENETGTSEGAAVNSRSPNQAKPFSDNSQADELDVYFDLSCPEGKPTRKPLNQILRVELAARAPVDTRSFRVFTPEPSDADSRSPEINVPECSSEEVPIVPETKDRSPREPNGSPSPGIGSQARVIPVEVFSRNLVDPAYSFSDEDEPALPRRSAQKPSKVTRARHKSLGSVCNDMHAEVTNDGEGPTTGELPPGPDFPTTAGSLTLNVQLDDNVGSHTRNLGELSAEGRGASHALSSVAEGASGGPVPAFDKPQKPRKSRGKSMHEPRESMALQPDSGLPSTMVLTETTKSETGKSSSSTRKRKPSNGAQQQDTPTRTVSKNSFTKSNLYEAPQAPSDAQGILNSRPARKLRSGVLEIPDSDPPIPSGNLGRAPSPTLTDPSSKPQTAKITSVPKQPATPSKPPSTPIKKSTNRRPPKSSQQSSSTTAPPPPTTTTTTTITTTTTGTKQRQKRGVLSLAPDDDDEEGADELSITPRSTHSLQRRPPGAGTTLLPFRTSPAAHHVRVSLLRTPSGRKRKGVATRGALGNASPSPSLSSSKVRLGAVGPPGGADGEGEGEGEGELVQTPGGTMRRCGEGGFRCGRDFCFGCL